MIEPNKFLALVREAAEDPDMPLDKALILVNDMTNKMLSIFYPSKPIEGAPESSYGGYVNLICLEPGLYLLAATGSPKDPAKDTAYGCYPSARSAAVVGSTKGYTSIRIAPKVKKAAAELGVGRSAQKAKKDGSPDEGKLWESAFYSAKPLESVQEALDYLGIAWSDSWGQMLV